MTGNKPCPKCRERGDDSKGDHFYRAVRGSKLLNFWICRKCKYREFVDGTPVKEEPEPMTAYKLSDAEIASLPSVSDRGIPEKVRKLYGVVTEFDPTTGLMTKHYYPRTSGKDTVAYKVRDIAKKSFTKTQKGVANDTELFGMKSLKGTPRNVIITEGEEDAMAAHHMLEGKMHGTGCLSLPDGTGSVRSISKNLEWLAKAQKVYFVPDNDAEGKKIIEKVVQLLPDVLIVEDLSEKDANDMLKEGKLKAFQNCVLRAKKYTPPFLVRVSDVRADAIRKPEWGRPYPWNTLTMKTYGMRDGEGMFVGAGVKIGKSEWINELIESRIAEGDIPACAKFEEQPSLTVKKMAGKRDGTFYHRPDIKFDQKVLEKSVDALDGKMLMYKAFGRADWDMLKLWIRFVVGEGSKTIIIDPVTKLTNHLSSSDTETELRRISDELACMAQDLGFFYIVTCHLKTPKTGPPHEKGGHVESSQFRGSRAMMENCYYMLGIERDKSATLSDIERNTSTFVLLEDRSFGNTCRFPVFYDGDTGSYLEAPLIGSKHL